MTAPHERVAHRAAVGRFRDGADFYEVNDGGGPELVGSASMTRVIVCQKLRVLTTGQLRLFNRGAFDPWSMQYRAANNNFRWIVEDGTGATLVAESTSNPEDDVGSIVIFAGAHDGSNAICHLTGSRTGSVASNGGIGAAGNFLAIGELGGAGDASAEGFAILAAMGTDNQALTAAQLATLVETELVDNLEQGRSLDFGLSTFSPEVYWDARDAVIGGGGTRTTWTDRIAGVGLTKNGSPEGLSVPCRMA